MSDLMFCVYFQENRSSMIKKVYMSELGDILQKHISQDAWNLWKAHQIKLINEYRLTPHMPADKAFLKKEMIIFLKISHFFQ
jgi:Fe-S cluster biosynthesis and repair protein YggX